VLIRPSSNRCGGAQLVLAGRSVAYHRNESVDVGGICVKGGH
jgi:hypothetical protein